MRCVGRTDDMLIVRGVNVFPSAVREVVTSFAPDVSGHVLVRPATPRGQARAAASRDGRARAADEQATTRSPRRFATDCARSSSFRPASTSCRGAASGGASTSRTSSNAEREPHAEDPDPGRPPHHARRRRPPDVDRLLGRAPRHAVRLRAAEPRQRVGEPPLLRPGRRTPDHGLHERGARARRARGRRGIPAPCSTSRSRSRRRRSTRSSSGSTSEASLTAGSRIAASWTRSTSTTRSGSSSSSRRTGSSRRPVTPTRTSCSRRTSSASSAATTTSRRSISPTRSRRSSSARGRRSPTTAHPENPYP